MIFLSTLSFRKSLSQLLKAKKGEYTSIRLDIAKVFHGKKPDEIFSSPDMIKQETEFKIIKIRLSNTNSKLSKRDGYRLIYLINSKKDNVCLFYVYPKMGSLAQDSISDNDLKRYLVEYLNGYTEKSLVCLDLVNMLSINKKHLCNIETCVHEQIPCTTND